MKKNIIVLLVMSAMVAISLLFTGCVGEKQGKAKDVVVTNTVVMKDISQSKVIQEEARKTIINVISFHSKYAEYQIKKDAEVKFVGVAAYNTQFNSHHIVFDFISDLEKVDKVKICIYMVLIEEDGKYRTDPQKSMITVGDISDGEAILEEKYESFRRDFISRAKFGHN